MLFLEHWARKLSWQETAVSFRSGRLQSKRHKCQLGGNDLFFKVGLLASRRASSCSSGSKIKLMAP
jgi:hypothetical protein